MAVREGRLIEVARRHLPREVAARWISLIRPAVRLRAARHGEKRVGRLGGLPALPDDVAWPEWEGEGPLTFIASIDCGRLPSAELDVDLPDDGTLLFFYFDPPVDVDVPLDLENLRTTVNGSDPESLTGARVTYVPAGTHAVQHPAPAGAEPYEPVPLAAEPTFTGPDWFHPAFRKVRHDISDTDRSFLDDWANRDAFMSALDRLIRPPRHQIGGHALPVQDAVELDVAASQLAVRPPFDDRTRAALQQEGQRWTLLAQFDSDKTSGMMWGDVGTLYWLIRPEDLAARNFAAASFTWQCT